MRVGNVQLVKAPDAGVPKTGVTNVGLVANTATPVPVSSEISALIWADVVAANCDRLPVVRAPLVTVSALPVTSPVKSPVTSHYAVLYGYVAVLLVVRLIK